MRATPEQIESAKKKIIEIFGSKERLAELCKDPSLKSWWTAIQDEQRRAMLKIDYDQARSWASIFKVPPKIPPNSSRNSRKYLSNLDKYFLN